MISICIYIYMKIILRKLALVVQTEFLVYRRSIDR
jgi:hypothetical protein